MIQKVICPRCGQDYLRLAEIEPLKERISICPECEAFWAAEAPTTIETFRDYGNHLASVGLAWDWKLLKFLCDPEK